MGTNTNSQITKKLSKLGTHAKLNHKKNVQKIQCDLIRGNYCKSQFTNKF
ncbi:hypothetical protein LEP1GSC059_0227 [Leptospira noguchii serovar Panama str. CZ214]|uniref:Uncharacterized protein n=1 Tax=Leptospira noguchii serovar Panama str. CZ214 TaxID=1001595 RepID=T0FIS9_9LEPT|nr:hypothetical protein LEP1GSC059_0227 [Leptospira noguchii serovar Panama str. CZ214]